MLRSLSYRTPTYGYDVRHDRALMRDIYKHIRRYEECLLFSHIQGTKISPCAKLSGRALIESCSSLIINTSVLLCLYYCS